MPNYTPNINLKKPLGIEFYDVGDQNGNMDIIDTQVGLLKAKDTSIDGQITTLQNDKGIWIGGLERGITDLNDAPDGVVPFTETSLNRPPGTLFGSVHTSTGRNPNFRIQEAFDDATEYGGKYVRKKVLGTWYSWQGPINFNDVVVGKEEIVDAINDKGVTASTTDSYPTLANKIRSITTGNSAMGIITKNIPDGIQINGLSFTPTTVIVRNHQSVGGSGGFLMNGEVSVTNPDRTLTINVYSGGFSASGTVLSTNDNIEYQAFG